MAMRRARLIVTAELLREALNLPATTDVIGATTGRYGTVEIFVEDPALKELDPLECAPLPVVCPTFKKNPPVEFIGWNQE